MSCVYLNKILKNKCFADMHDSDSFNLKPIFKKY